MAKIKKNVYLAAFARELTDYEGVDAICKALGIKDGTESDAYCWLEEGRTEKEIIQILRKIGYDIPKEIMGSTEKKFDSTVQE